MKPVGLVLFALASGGVERVVAANANAPIDYTQRNTPFGASATVKPPAEAPTRNESVQDKRVTPPTIEKKPAAVAERRSAVEVREGRDKKVHEKDSYRPSAAAEPLRSSHNHQAARISTATDTSKPPMVSKYQDSLVAASATNMARFPAVGAATSAKINRFVFRRNPPESATALPGAKITPAAGPSK